MPKAKSAHASPGEAATADSTTRVIVDLSTSDTDLHPTPIRVIPYLSLAT